MAFVNFKGNQISLNGVLPKIGDKLPDFIGVSNELQELSLSEFLGSKVVINFAPSIDTEICQLQLKKFNARAKNLGAKVLFITLDLPFAHGRFCSSGSIESVQTLSDFRYRQVSNFGLKMADGPLKGLAARAVICADENGVITYLELVPEITQEPDYDAVVLT